MAISDLFIYGGVALMIFSVGYFFFSFIKASKKISQIDNGGVKAIIVAKNVVNDPYNGVIYYITFNIGETMVNLRTTINVYNAFNVGYTALIKYNGDVLVSIK